MTVSYRQSRPALSHQTPGNDLWPEGEDFPAWLAVELADARTVLEFGCGAGRLAVGFGLSSYIGVDVSRFALHDARVASPHDFRLIEEHEPLPEADAVFTHTVLLHVSDEELTAVVARLAAAAPVVFVSEIMARKWRRPGNPPVFNREPEEYVQAFKAAGMKLLHRWDLPYHRYGGVLFTVLRFERST